MQINIPELYEEKKRRLEQIISYYENNRMGYINVPTGWGKTLLSLHLVKNYSNQGKRVLYLVSRNNPLLAQSYYEDQNSTNPKFPESIALSSDFNINNIDLNEIKKSIIFASLQTISSEKREKLYKNFCSSFDLVIIDEIHNFIKNQGNLFIEDLSTNSKVFGMTATPYQGVIGKEKYVREISIEMKEIFNKTISQCIKDGELSPIKYNIIRNNIDIDKIFDFKSGFKEEGLNLIRLEEGLDKYKLIIERTRLAKQIYDKKVSSNSKTLIFCVPIEKIKKNTEEFGSIHAKICAGIFNEEITTRISDEFPLSNKDEKGNFKKAVYLSSDLNKKEIKDIINDFKKPDEPPFIVCTVGMITEGFDYKRLNNLFLLRPTFSMRLFEQQLGRITRIHHNKKRGNVYEIVDNINLKSLFDKFPDIFSDKKFKKMIQLNPESRIERLFFEKKGGEELVAKNLLQLCEIHPDTGLNNLRFDDNEYEYSETIKNIHFIEYKIKIFKDLLEISEKRKTAFLENLMILILKFNVFSIEDYRKITQLVISLKERYQIAQNDSSISNEDFKKIYSQYNNLISLIRLKVLAEIKSDPELIKMVNSDCSELFGIRLQPNNLNDLMKTFFYNGTNKNPEQLFKTINEIFKINKKFQVNKNNRYGLLLNKKLQIRNINHYIRKSIIWLATYFSDNPIAYFNKHFKNSSYKKILQKTYF